MRFNSGCISVAAVLEGRAKLPLRPDQSGRDGTLRQIRDGRAKAHSVLGRGGIDEVLFEDLRAFTWLRVAPNLELIFPRQIAGDEVHEEAAVAVLIVEHLHGSAGAGRVADDFGDDGILVELHLCAEGVDGSKGDLSELADGAAEICGHGVFCFWLIRNGCDVEPDRLDHALEGREGREPGEAEQNEQREFHMWVQWEGEL